MGRQLSSAWFSRYFGINKPQYELPFVDFLLNTDVPLYIDSFAITKDRSELAVRCHDSIVSYFQTLLDAVRVGDTKKIRYLVYDRLVEPREIHLGVAKKARTGIGLGRIQGSQIVEALANSQALKSGVIHDIQELELHIEGIGPDKISDLVANIIKGQLAQYTQEVCQEYDVRTRRCAVNSYWNSDTLKWDASFFNLPVKGTDAYILVPKRFVRREKDMVNHDQFYDHYVLEILEREMLEADDSLVETLKNGRRRVTKKSLREDPRFAKSKAYISHFIQEHPGSIEQYRGDLNNKFVPLDPAALSGKAAIDDPTVQAYLSKIEKLPVGRQYANEYHDTIFMLLEFVFDWCFQNFEKEYGMDQGRGRMDIICDNYADGGLLAEWRTRFQATSVPIECKNYKSDLGNNEFNQLNDRLGEKSTRLGFLFCRQIDDLEEMGKHVTYRWLRHHNCILLFDDKYLKKLVTLRLMRDYPGIEKILRLMFRDVEYGSHSKLLESALT